MPQYTSACVSLCHEAVYCHKQQGKSNIITSLVTSTAGVEVEVNFKEADGEEHSAFMSPPLNV